MILQDRVTSWNHYVTTITVPMAMKLSRMVTYLEGLLIVKLCSALIRWPCKVMWQTKIISLLPECLWLPISVTYFERLLTIKSFITLITWSCKVTWQTKIIVYPQPYPQLYIHAYGYKIGSILIYLHVFLPLKSHHPLITWPCKITWPTKIIISPLPQCQWPPNLLRWWYTLTDS